MRSFSLALLILSTFGADAAEVVPTAGPWHPRCWASFGRLPIDEFGYPTNTNPDGSKVEVTSMTEHLARYSWAYRAYDRDCFKPLADLKTPTRKFIDPNLGIVLTDDPGFFCAAFRLGPDKFITAGHCAGDIEGAESKAFHLLAEPDRAIPILGQLPPATPETSTDFTDFAVFRIEDPQVEGYWTQKDFSRTILPNQVVIIVAVSLIPRELNPRMANSKWTDDVRFSRSFSSRLWPIDEVETNLPKGSDRSGCIYHKAPTFPGMSGAPIVAVHAPKKANEPPTFSVTGMHLRNGDWSLEGCGKAPQFNVGLKIPKAVIHDLE
ncbi:hypothetical protein CN234_21630 [Sinorhizobium meliloti]|uniref:hypothetical protein n=2 Tax=Rhizobium meliloti TaxID=382 RepID=UPI000FDB25B5|nr:hypothetical protein [Sinorhizobium meliloti]RVG06613.1 hypothetical protein CN234_21630 [Sinorhizobium meliloti]